MVNMLRMCLNWKVIGGLAAVGLGIWVFAPQLVGATLPLLILAICPLSMLIMMWGMNRGMGMRGMQGGDKECAAQPGTATLPLPVVPSGSERITDLKAQQQEIARQIADLEAAPRGDLHAQR